MCKWLNINITGSLEYHRSLKTLFFVYYRIHLCICIKWGQQSRLSSSIITHTQTTTWK